MLVLFMVFVNLQFSTASYYVKCLPLFYLKELINYYLIYSDYLFWFDLNFKSKIIFSV